MDMKRTEPPAPPSPARSADDDDPADYWDPPCALCKHVDDLPNVVCDLCNAAYHIHCLATLPPLPRAHDDPHWFCRTCVRRGVPEQILDRVGRGASAHYLVKWLGRPAWDVSWEDGSNLDTPWSRGLIRDAMTNRAKGPAPPLLPPCHSLVDLQVARQAASAGSKKKPRDDAASVASPASTPTPAPTLGGWCGSSALEPKTAPRVFTACELAEDTLTDEMEAAHLADEVGRLCESGSAAAPAGSLVLACVAREARRVLDSCVDARGQLLWKKVAAAPCSANLQAVEAIVDERTVRGHTQYHVKWRDCKEPSWVPKSRLEGTDAVNAHLRRPTSRTGDAEAPAAAAVAEDVGAAAAPLTEPRHTSTRRALGVLQAARATFERALRGKAERSSATPVTKRWASAGKPAGTTLVRAAAAKPAGYQGLLEYLREHTSRLRTEVTHCTPRNVERAAVAEWKSLSLASQQAYILRAQETLGGLLSKALDKVSAADIHAADETQGGGILCGARETSRRGWKKVPCDVCGEGANRRDIARCSTCPTQRHLMCFTLPLQEADEAWQCDACMRAGVEPAPPAPPLGSRIEVEIAKSELSGGGGEWVPATVRSHITRIRFEATLEGDKHGHVELEQLSTLDEKVVWRRSLEAQPEAEGGGPTAAEREVARAARRKAFLAATKEGKAIECADVEVSPSPLLASVEAVYRDGYAVADGALTPAQVSMCTAAVDAGYKELMHRVRTLDLQEQLESAGFMQIKMRSGGRYDLQLPELSTPPFSFLLRDAPWMPLVHAILGEDAALTHFGCMLSFPGSATQPWHTDGPHVRGSDEMGAANGNFVAPPHAINVFVPLVDLSRSNGPTELVPGSQHDFDTKASTRTECIRAGQAVIFDYRLKHRGLGNTSALERPLLYITYSHNFFLDVYNFDRKRYPNLPEVSQHLSREERRAKRMKLLHEDGSAVAANGGEVDDAAEARAAAGPGAAGQPGLPA